MVSYFLVALKFAIVSISIYLILALVLIGTQWISTAVFKGSLDFDAARATVASDPGLIHDRTRDGAQLGLRRFAPQKDQNPLVILLHGSGWHGGAYVALGEALNEQLGYEVLIPDLRGHGPDPIRRGDLDYIGQFEDDLADLIETYRGKERPAYLVGHSSGGGLAIRFAGGKHGHLVSRAVLIAPYLSHDAPTARKDGGNWAKVLLRRTIGLSMLNAVGVRAFNHLHMIQFNFPIAVLDGPNGHSATQSYSFRLNTSFAPRRPLERDVAALPDFLLIAGQEDDAFDASAYETTLSAITTNGHYQLMAGASHLGVLYDDRVHEAISQFLNREK